MSKKQQIESGYKDFFEDLSEYKGLDKEAKDFIHKFYFQMYRDVIIDKNNPIITSPNMIKEARKNHNYVKRDAFRVASRGTNDVVHIEDMNPEQYSDFMNTMSDEQEWRTAYKIGGYQLAAMHVINDTMEKIKLHDGDKQLSDILLNLILTFRELRLEYNRARKHKREHK